VQEDILYERVVSTYEPVIVLLAFYANDVHNNHPLLDGGPERRTRLTYRDADGNLIHFRHQSPFFGLRKWLRIHSATFRLLKAVHRRARHAFITKTETHDDSERTSLPSEYNVYGPPPNDIWKEAWDTTEKAILALHQHIELEGKEFFLLLVPELLQVDPDPVSLLRREYGVEPPSGFDPTYPHKRISEFSERHGIKVIDPLPTFLQYRDAHSLSFPYFFYTCNGHWNPLGHRLVAESISETIAPLVKEN